MAANLLVATNPTRKRHQSAAQRRASLANLRKARRARAGTHHKRRRNPESHRTRVSAARKGWRTRRHHGEHRRHPARRRNPIVSRSMVERTLMPALIGGAGAVTNDVAYNIVLGVLPAGGFIDQLRTGPMRHLGKAASALALAYIAKMFMSRRNAETLGIGALTVVGYNVVKDMVTRFAPNLPLGDMGAYLQPMPGLGYAGAGYAPSGALNPRYGSNFNQGTGLAGGARLGAYLAPRLRGLGQSAQAFGVPRQLSQPNPYGLVASPSMAGAESYSEGY